MKKITLVLVCLVYILINKSYASNDSLVIINDTLKETNLTTEVEETLVNEDKKLKEQPLLAQAKIQQR